jgi:glycosyltransferase involved in cell wall biosynthesis
MSTSLAAGRAPENEVRSEAQCELTVLMPCLNEAETLAACIESARRMLAENKIDGEVLIADNGSTDGSIEIARTMGARLIHVPEKGYGSAISGGVDAARGRFVVMADADCSYDFAEVPRLLKALRCGYDLVMGNRFQGGIKDRAMPRLHKYLGNPVLTAIGKLFFKAPCSDFHCGLRGFTRDAFQRMDLHTTGMELASEMVVKAALFGMKIDEVPVTLSPDRRSRPPHLRSWRDGWRHLRFLLLYSPRWLFLYPGSALIAFGMVATALLLPGRLGKFDVHTLLYGFSAISLGFQLLLFAVFTKVFAISEGLLPEDPQLSGILKYVRLETGLMVGIVLTACGFAGSVAAVTEWGMRNFSALDPGRMLRIVIPSAFAMMLGVEIICGSFFLSILGLRRR